MRSKALVYTMFILELVQTILFTSSAFKMFATGFGNAAVLDRIDLLWFSIPVMSGLGEYQHWASMCPSRQNFQIDVLFFLMASGVCRTSLLCLPDSFVQNCRKQISFWTGDVGKSCRMIQKIFLTIMRHLSSRPCNLEVRSHSAYRRKTLSCIVD